MEHDTPSPHHAGGQRNRDHVVARRPPEVLSHLAIGRAAERDDPWHVTWVATHKHDVSRLDGNVRPRTDGDADIGRHECRRVVDAVAHHRDALTLGLQLTDLRRLLIGKHLGHHAVDAELSANALRDSARIAGEHRDLDLLVVQSLHCLA
jgi:hypothetical protein